MNIKIIEDTNKKIFETKVNAFNNLTMKKVKATQTHLTKVDGTILYTAIMYYEV